MAYSILTFLAPSKEQESAVSARNCDVVVTAGAGTGKTRTLVARYLSLLADGLPLRSVVAITFTRKAAREMRNRVRKALHDYLQCADLPPDEAERWRGLDTQLDAARIDTIHGLCAELLRSHPAEAGVDPRFQVLEDAQANLLRQQALDETLAWAAEDAAAAQWFALLGEQSLRQTLAQLLASRLDVQEALLRLPEDVRAYWRQQLARHQEDALLALRNDPAWKDALAVLRDNCADSPADALEGQRRMALVAIEGAVGPLEAQLRSLAALSRITLQGGSAKAWPGGAAQKEQVKNALGNVRKMWKESDPCQWDWTATDEELASSLPALRAMFAFACARYTALKREQNALDFDDLESGALQLLRANAAVRAYWQAQVQALLVDEFQDTNGRQHAIASLLNGDRSRLFVVGDAKQSIYRFRGADVTVFHAERERVRATGGQVLPLEVSYRAHHALVEGLNDLLRPVLGERHDPQRPWAEPFARLEAHRVDPGPGFEAPHIELHLAIGTKSLGALERAADALAVRLWHLVGSGQFHTCDGDAMRPLRFEDVAILCRASTSFAAYEDSLERAGIPFVTVAGRGFYDRPEIRDLLNALQALADPTDDLALAGLLRSPAFALSDVDLYRLCQARERCGQATPLWDALQHGSRLGVAWDDVATERVQRAVRIVHELHGLVGRTPVANVLKAFLDETDYRAALIQAGQARAARNVAKLLADANRSAIVGVGAFLEYASGLRSGGAREGEARTPAEGAVQIMSVHQAKGLEFPVVVIGDVSSQGGGRHSALVDPELGVLLPKKGEDDQLGAVYRLGKARDADKEDAETARLFYVATTRAKEKLILSGCVGLTQSGRLKPEGWLGRLSLRDPGGSALNEITLKLDMEGARVIPLELYAGHTRVACSVYEPGYVGAYPRYTAVAAPPQPSAVLPPPLLQPVRAGEVRMDERSRDTERDPPQRVWRVVPAVHDSTAPAWVVGKIVHAALAQWHFGDGFERWAEARARSLGLTDRQQLDAAVGKSRQLLHGFVQHSLFREMERAERRLHEVPYSLETDGRLENGVIDALYLHEGAWTVVEFKTDRVHDEAKFRELLAAEGYLTQARRYVAATERLLGQRPRLILCMLDYAGSPRVVGYDAL